ncbi:MAG: tetratricopeptide repeat protein [Pseudomonadota bacterium]|nr:tetratricopeptide repeat protein [Pseudomonadota bacterium]
MLNLRAGQLKWSRLIIIGAALVLAGALWTAHSRVQGAPGAALSPSATTSEPQAATPEMQVQSHPQDPAAWRALGESRFEAGQYALATDAYSQAVALAPSSAAVWSALGESRVMASAHDPMPAEALKDFREANTIDAREPRARYFLAVHKDLTGDHDGAISDWLALLGDTPKGAPWEADLRRTIEQVGRINHKDVAVRIAAVHQPAPLPATPQMAGIAGPTAEDLQAAASIPPSQQQAMAQAMVARLEQRLAADPHNADGWAMLIRSRMTLDGPEQASAALARAVAADPADAAQLRQQAQALGVK